MFYNRDMDSFERLRMLSSDMGLEPAEDAGCSKVASHSKDILLTDAVLPGGKRIHLLKTLLTSACERNCYYCPFRAGRDFRRETFKPEDLANTFMALHRAGLAQGFFLSSGIIGRGLRTQDRLIDTADILRNKLGFQGYIHLKIMPGAERDQVVRSMQLANRVSINLEAPNPLRLEKLAPHKIFFEELVKPLQWVHEIRQTQDRSSAWNQRWPSSVTQFVVGGAGETDHELLSTSETLYHELGLQRAYYSPFNPIPGTPLEDHPPTPAIRERRLYQASFLLRDYGYTLDELPFDETGSLPFHQDPKMVWAQSNLTESPLEINRANRRELLHLPGIGLKSASAILARRNRGCIRSLSELGVMGINTARLERFVLVDGQRPFIQKTFW